MQSDAPTTDLDWNAIEAILPAGWRDLASEMKLVRPNLPEHVGTKVKDIGPILRLVLYQVARNTALLSVRSHVSRPDPSQRSFAIVSLGLAPG